MFLCLPIIFIISISEMRSDKSFSVASAEVEKAEVRGCQAGLQTPGPSQGCGIMPGPPFSLPLTLEHLHRHLGHTVRLVLVKADGFCQHHLPEAAFSQRLAQDQPGGRRARCRGSRLVPAPAPPSSPSSHWGRAGPHLSRGSSQRGSSGSSYSETPASMGVPLEERREGRTSITPEFIDELESADTCRGTVGYLHAVPGPAAGCPPGGRW